MNICRVRHIPGPNIYHNKSVLIMTLDLENLAEVSSTDIPGFIPRLLEILPGLQSHHCSPGHPGGFVERLHRGTYLAHIIEHIALELSEPAGIPVTYGKSVYAGEPGVYNVIVRSKSEAGMGELLRIAVGLAESVVKGEPFPLAECLEKAKRLASETALGPSTRAIVEAAEDQGIPWFRLNENSLVQLGYGKYRKHIQAALTSQTSSIATETASDKDLTKTLLSQASVPVPKGRTVSTLESALQALEEIAGPVVVKPLNGNHGRGVTLHVRTAEQLATAFLNAQEHSSSVLIEEVFRGNDYRVLVVDGKFVAAAHRCPARVVGDGVHSIRELIKAANEDPKRGEGHERAMTKIDMDEAILFLSRNGHEVARIPKLDEIVYLSDTANLSTGGTATDVTEDVHPKVKFMCERAARTIGLDICGIDLILNDISQPPAACHNGIIEVNAGPGLRMHLYPSSGKSRDVGKAIIDMLYPEGAKSRIPLISITGTNGKTTVTRLISHVLSQKGETVGMTTTGGIWIGGQEIVQGDTTGPASAKTVLSDTTVDVAVLETARGGMVRRGLGYDWSDIGVVTNIQLDHVGQDGIEGIDDIIRIKSLVPERVREGGTVVLNADDENVVRMMEIPRLTRTPKNLVYFSIHPDHLLIKRHVASGGKAYVVRGGQVVELHEGTETPVVEVARVPLTFNGTADFQIANVLATVAACRAHGASLENVREGLLSFSAEKHNHGRANTFRVREGYVIVDYGHNPEAFRAICRMTSKWTRHRTTGVIGVPGDRADSLIKESGAVIADGFDQIILRDDRDLRGRQPGEAARLLCEAIKERSPGTSCRCVPNELQAIRTALEEIQPNEIVVAFLDEDVEAILGYVKDLGGQPISTIPFLGGDERLYPKAM